MTFYSLFSFGPVKVWIGNILFVNDFGSYLSFSSAFIKLTESSRSLTRWMNPLSAKRDTVDNKTSWIEYLWVFLLILNWLLFLLINKFCMLQSIQCKSIWLLIVALVLYWAIAEMVSIRFKKIRMTLLWPQSMIKKCSCCQRT